MATLNSVLGRVDYNKLIAGPNRGEIKTIVMVGTGSAFKRGELVTYAEGKIKAITTKEDAVFGIIVDDVDTSSEDAPVTVYLNGDFNKEAITVANSVAVDDLFLSARNVGIIFR